MQFAKLPPVFILESQLDFPPPPVESLAGIGTWPSPIGVLSSPEVSTRPKSILKNKRLSFWRELLLSIDYPDMNVFTEATEGTHSTGQVPLTKFFLQFFKPTKASPSQVKGHAAETRKQVLSCVMPICCL